MKKPLTPLSAVRLVHAASEVAILIARFQRRDGKIVLTPMARECLARELHQVISRAQEMLTQIER